MGQYYTNDAVKFKGTDEEEKYLRSCLECLKPHRQRTASKKIVQKDEMERLADQEEKALEAAWNSGASGSAGRNRSCSFVRWH